MKNELDFVGALLARKLIKMKMKENYFAAWLNLE